MKITTEKLQALADAGLTPDQVAMVVSILCPPLSSGALRQRRWRERKASQSVSSVTVETPAQASQSVSGRLESVSKASPGDVSRASLARVEDNNLFPSLENRKEERKNPPLSPPETLRDVFELATDRLIAVYPRREGGNPRRPAVKALKARLNAGADFDEIIAGASEFAAEMKTRGKVGTEFVPMLATWLNQERWTDAQNSNGISQGKAAEYSQILYGNAHKT